MATGRHRLPLAAAYLALPAEFDDATFRRCRVTPGAERDFRPAPVLPEAMQHDDRIRVAAQADPTRPQQ